MLKTLVAMLTLLVIMLVGYIQYLRGPKRTPGGAKVYAWSVVVAGVATAVAAISVAAVTIAGHGG